MTLKSAATLVALLLTSFASRCATAQDASVSSQANGAATYHWDADSPISGDDFLITSIPSTFTGANVASIIGANTFYTNGYTGAGTISMNVEAGHIWNGHDTLTNVTSFSNAAGVPNSPYVMPAYDRHATWVGMMIGGRQGGSAPGIYQEGIAKGTDLRSAAVATSWSGTAWTGSFNATTFSLASGYLAGFGTANVINSSWGAVGGSGSPEAGGTDVRTMIVDSLAYANPFTTFVASAGNSGASGNNTVGAPGSGYNGITVGALQNNGANVYNSVATFSSHGPQDYRNAGGPSVLLARAAVDIAAPGTDLTSAFYGGRSGGNDPSLSGSSASGGPNLYSGGLAGTSFAAPITAGAVSLMDGAAINRGLAPAARDARVIKANLLNAAAKIPGWNNGEVPHPNGNGGVRTTQALDYFSGAGALDLNRTYSQYLLGQTDIPGTIGGVTTQAVGWDYASVALNGATDVTIATPLSGGSQFRATLTWFRNRTYINSDSQSDNDFANLDLQVWDSTFTTLISESVSTYTPVEHLTFNLPTTGLYGLRVRYPANLFGSDTSTNFGLAWWGAAVPEPSAMLMLLIGFGCCMAHRPPRS